MRNKVCCAALILRLILIVWGYYQDNYSTVPYTDIDYKVFTDAARHVVQGQSPYDRPTYRYTPLLAWIMTPNILLNSCFGKCLFSLIDIANGFIIYEDVTMRFGSDWALRSLCVWLFNPITLVVSTRGNAESLITLVVLLTLRFHRQSQFLASGIFLGLATHLKIYPIIYSVVLYTSASSSITTLFQSLKPNLKRLQLVFGFCLSLAVSSIVGYLYYGWPFIHETYLYHVTRQDVRHNFSPYFYLLYLHGDGPSGPLASLLAFLPQLFLVLALSWRYRSQSDLSWALFVLTFGFVSFNKVVTSQYFLWYLSLLPLCLPELIPLGWIKTLTLVVAWMGSQGVWLFCAYRLEFLGHNVLFHVWLASLLFLAVNVWLLVEFLKARTTFTIKKKKKKTK